MPNPNPEPYKPPDNRTCFEFLMGVKIGESKYDKTPPYLRNPMHSNNRRRG